MVIYYQESLDVFVASLRITSHIMWRKTRIWLSVAHWVVWVGGCMGGGGSFPSRFHTLMLRSINILRHFIASILQNFGQDWELLYYILRCPDRSSILFQPKPGHMFADIFFNKSQNKFTLCGI